MTYNLERLLAEVDGVQLIKIEKTDSFKSQIDLLEKAEKQEPQVVSLEKIPASPMNITNTAPDKEGGFALIPDYSSFRNTWWGQQQPIAYATIWKAYLQEPIVRSCVTITVEAITGDGYLLKSENEGHLTEMVKIFKENRFQKVLQDIVTSLIIYGDGYTELIRAKEANLVEKFRPADAATIRADYDEHGHVIKYIQRVFQRRVDFYPDELVHFSLNNVGGRVYGNSDFQAIIFTLQAKMYAQNFNTEYFRRPGLPRSLYLSKNLSKEQNDRLVQQLRQATPQTDIFLNSGAGEITHTMIAPSNTDMQFVELMQFLRTEIIAATGVPPIFLGITEGSNRANAQTQLEAWDRKKKSRRLAIADIFNHDFMTVANFGFDDVKFSFADENSREDLKRGQLAQLMSQIPDMTPNQVREAMNLDPLEDKQFVYNSITDRIYRPSSSDGDRTFRDLDQEAAEKAAEMQASLSVIGGAPGAKKDNKNGGSADPRRNQTKADNSEHLNSAQAKESKGQKFLKANPARDYPYGAVEPEHDILDSIAAGDMKARLKAIGEAQWRAAHGVSIDWPYWDGKQPDNVVAGSSKTNA